VFSALGEFFWYLSRRTDLEFIDYYVPGAYVDESDDGVTVRSGYGERLFSHNGVNQVDNVIRLLGNRRTSRQAVVQLFDAADIAQTFRSVPCTCTLQFLARDDKLSMMVSMRSNDAFLGLPHDVFAFTMFQEIVARSIGCKIGEYKHCVGSLHLYDEHRGKAQTFIDEGWQSRISMPAMPEGNPWPNVAAMQKIEESLRLRGEGDIEGSNLGDYWKDICRLLAAYRAYRDDNAEWLRELRKSLKDETYKLFVDARIDVLDSKRQA
jgi:thymidylate synthase